MTENALRDGLGPYVRELTRRIGDLDADELRARIVGYASRLPIERRKAFSHAFVAMPVREGVGVAGVVAAAAALRADLEAGVYEHRSDEADYQQEEAVWEDTSWTGPLSVIVDAATAAFLATDDAAAFAIYTALFGVLDAEDDYGALFTDDDLGLVGIDRPELVARYLRTAIGAPGTLEGRTARVLDAIETADPTVASAVGLVGASEARADLVGDIDAVAQALLPHVVARLEHTPGSRVWETLTVEAALMAGGADLLGTVVLAAKPSVAPIFVDWVDALRLEGRASDAIAAANTCLGRAIGSATRASLLDRLVVLEADHGNDAAAFDTALVALDVEPTLARTAVVADFAQAANDPDDAFARAAELFASPARSKTLIGGLLLILAGRLEASVKAARSADPVGWTTGNAASVVVASVLRLALGAVPSARVDELLRLPSQWPHTTDPTHGARLAEIAAERLAVAAGALPPDSISEALSRVGVIIDARIAAIVGAKHRGAYPRAALVGCAYAETLAATQSLAAGATPFLTTLQERYPRHTSFKQALADERRRGPRI